VVDIHFSLQSEASGATLIASIGFCIMPDGGIPDGVQMDDRAQLSFVFCREFVNQSCSRWVAEKGIGRWMAMAACQYISHLNSSGFDLNPEHVTLSENGVSSRLRTLS